MIRNTFWRAHRAQLGLTRLVMRILIILDVITSYVIVLDIDLQVFRTLGLLLNFFDFPSLFIPLAPYSCQITPFHPRIFLSDYFHIPFCNGRFCRFVRFFPFFTFSGWIFLRPFFEAQTPNKSNYRWNEHSQHNN